MKTQKKTGRPSIYETRIAPYLDVIAYMKSQGRTDDEVVKMLGVSKRSFNNHKVVVDEFVQSYAQGKERMVDAVEATVFDIAMGRVQRKMVKIRKNAEGKVTSTEETIENQPPNISAAIFILKGLRKDIYNNDTFEQDVIEIPENETFAAKFLGAIDEKTGR